jgi:hypothetical protein
MLSCGVSFFAVDEIILCLSIGSQQRGATYCVSVSFLVLQLHCNVL